MRDKGAMNRYRKTKRGGGLFSAIEHEQAVAAKTTGILKLRDVIPCESLRPLLEELTGYATHDWASRMRVRVEHMRWISCPGLLVLEWIRIEN
jgi:hypothetical protein